MLKTFIATLYVGLNDQISDSEYLCAYNYSRHYSGSVRKKGSWSRDLKFHSHTAALVIDYMNNCITNLSLQYPSMSIK